MSQWPEPTREPNEPPRWGGLGALVALIALVVVAANGSMLGSSWRLPEITMPEFSMPAFMPPEGPTPSESVAISEAPTFDPLSEPTTAADGSTVQSMPFESCVRTLEGMADSFGQAAAFVEDTAERRVASFKFLDSRLTVTCSRSEGTMTVQR